MNRQEFEDTARRYREELFRMYASQNPAAPPPKPQPRTVTPSVPDIAVQPETVPVQASLPADLPPEQSLRETPVPPQNPAQETEPEPSEAPGLPKRDYTGIIRVHTATAQGARPVFGAAVIITRIVQGDPELISLQSTDESGNIEPVQVPAPQPSADQRNPQSFFYDITVQAKGYYREHSADVPVFPHITSVQNFDLIPLPAGADEPDTGGDLTFYNNMQRY
ncbi:MAG: hypothetical protein MJ065_06850 [Oscillospiraceae bacterium]|nr:hypothetical protein [Oscillospiraceae bacterium]